MPGYGGTDKLTDTADYSTKKLAGDLVALLDLLGIEKAVGISYHLRIQGHRAASGSHRA
jgi:soluble epoxide hydrolase / lipid-phosphate phosphatase